MKFCRSHVLGVVLAGSAVACAGAQLTSWMQDVVGASAIEAALYRAMDLPGVRILYPRPPAESRNELTKLTLQSPSEAELYLLRAHADEQALDFNAAEADWNLYVTHAQDKPPAELQLADYYHRRLNAKDEIATLLLVGKAPTPASERFTPAQQQQAWQAFSRILKIADDQALPLETRLSTYHAWIARYPGEPSLFASLISLLLDQRKFNDADSAIEDYKRAFPKDRVFPLKASALIEYRRGSAANALALYEGNFEPLWPAELVQSYFAMLSAAHQQRRMLSDARARLIHNPDDLASAARIFYYYQQEGRLDATRRAIDEYRFSKDQRKAAWTADELYTFATLLDNVYQYDEAARYYFALNSVPASANNKLPTGLQSQEIALSGMVHLLLTAPDQGISLGSNNLSIYRDIATVDPGPGYLNGILSLWLNSQSPAREFNLEERRALPYFHRAKAAELLAILDRKFPSSVVRPDLHAALIRAYAGYGQEAIVIQAGNDFLKEYPNAARRLAVAMLMTDAYARSGDTASEFALYDRMLAELAAKSAGMPLTASSAMAVSSKPGEPANEADVYAVVDQSGQPADAGRPTVESALSLTISTPVQVLMPDDLNYGQLLDRYLGRLTTAHKLPEALAVLRRELDRSPDDPLLYERLALFLGQNNFSAQEEEVYRRAIDHFNSRDWYDKLARLFIREKRREDYSALTHRVIDTFRGTELDSYLRNESGGWPQITLQVNLYAHQRFPHDLTFTRNLLRAYRSRSTVDPAAWGKLMREHWFESADLSKQFFDYLSAHGKLDAEMGDLQKLQAEHNPAAMRELAEAELWQSHFEACAPLLGSLAKAYPADVVIGTQASSIYRSLAYFDPQQTARAVDIEKNLLTADPGNMDRLARIGDILSDTHGGDPQVANARPYWQRMPDIHPGLQDGYLQAATVFWDYFQLDDALLEISAARKQFHDETLYGYEAGAIEENKREPAQAMDEYVPAAIAGSEPARERLITLAGRPDTAQLVNAATSKAETDHPTLSALSLRADILEKQKQGTSVAGLLDSAVDRAGTFDEADQLASFAQQRQLTASYERALRREVTLVSDPVQRIEIQYALVRSLAARGEIKPAEQIVVSVYKDNPKIVGVVRTTTDFYWDHKQPQKAIATLIQAGHDAYPELSRSYALEAADKSNASGDYAVARQLVTPLLNADPYGANSARYLAILADSYARANDDGGLRDFYTAKLSALQSAQVSLETRRNQAALLRRGLILALTPMKDYAAAVDQHIALISAFPEDDAVLQDATLYALRYDRRQQLLAFLNKAVADSPRDARFAVDLGRAQTLFEDYPAAIDAYGKAIAIRKDRIDIYMARADLEERLQRFDDACTDYDRLYLLSYKDPQWMAKTAEARARQGENDQTVKALEAAWITGRPIEARNSFRVAEQLEKWNLLEEARTFAEQGLKQSGEDLLASPENQSGAMIYTRILTRQRRAADALKTLEAARREADISQSSPVLVLEPVKKQGIASVGDDEWRRHRAAERREQAATGFKRAVLQMGAVVAAFYTPEEKVAYARLLDERESHAIADEIVSVWIPAAMTAGLQDREAAWREHVLLQNSKFNQNQLQAFNLLEKQRMQNAERGRALEKYAARFPEMRNSALALAVDAWRDEADHAKELSVLGAMDLQSDSQQQGHSSLRDRYFQLLLRLEPNRLIDQAKVHPEEYADAAVSYMLAKGAPPLAYSAIHARGKSFDPIWSDAITALTGLYFNDKSSYIDSAFRTVVDDRSIGDRVSSKSDATRHLSGNVWFYYGMRYGVYRASAQEADAEAFLPSELEGDPGSPVSYTTLAEAYVDIKDTAAALREYNHALEIAPDTAALHRSIALLLWSSGKKQDALDQWREALALLRKLVDTRVVPESFWIDFAAVAGDVRQDQLIAQLQPSMDAVLRAYVAKNGEYRSVELLHSAFRASSSATQGVDWVLSVINAARNPKALLTQLDNETWIPKEGLVRILRRELELALSTPSPTTSQPEYGNYFPARIQVRLLQYYLDEKRTDEAQALFDSIPEKERGSDALQRLRIVLSAREGKIPQLLADFSAYPDAAPSTTVISAAATQLRESGDPASSRLLLEYIFDSKSARHDLADTDFLALAEARIDTGDLPDAVALLRRFTLFSPEPYGSLDSAASLLERSLHFSEALPFLTKLADTTPWKPEYRLRLAHASIKAQKETDQQDISSGFRSLAEIASSSTAGYSVRVRAAIELHGAGGAHDLHSAELTLLASGKAILPDQADKPFFLPARLAAATMAPATQRPAILRKAIAVAPSDELRLRIFEAEFALGHHEAALAATAPLLQSPSGYFQAADPTNNDDGSTEVSAAAADAAETTLAHDDSAEAEGNSLLPSILKGAKGKVDFALAIATLYQENDEYQQAISYARLASRLNHEDSRRRDIDKRILTLARLLRVENENAARRPIIREALDQAVVVRPRLEIANVHQEQP